MNPDMLFLAERLVSAMETISQDVKNISAYVYDLSYNVSHFLNDKNKKEDISVRPCNECGSLPRDPPPFAEGEYSSQCEQVNGSSVPQTDDMQHEEASVWDVGTINNVHSEKTEVLALFTGGLKIEELPESEESPFVHARNNERIPQRGTTRTPDEGYSANPSTSDFTDDIKDEIDILEDFFPLQEEADVPVTIEAPDLEDSTNHSTRYPEDQDSIPKTQKGNEACGSKGHLVHNNFEETDRADGILLRGYISNGEKPPHVSCRDTGASSSCSEEKLTEHNGKENEDQREKGGGARERGYRAQKKGKASAKKSHSEQSGRQKRKRGPLLCDTCGKSFSSKLHLEIHERIHTGERPFHCALCNKTYASKSHLVSHMKVHSDERPYKCSSCDKSFKEKGCLKIHIRVHNGEKPFICIVCGKAFTQHSSLSCHMRLHGGKKPFICRQCGKAFTRSSTLKCHLRQHSGEKPFICTECGKAFADHSNLQTHLRTHTGERPFPCRDCGSSFTQSSSLKRHRRRVHGVASSVS